VSINDLRRVRLSLILMISGIVTVRLIFHIRVCEYHMFNDLTDTDINFALRYSGPSLSGTFSHSAIAPASYAEVAEQDSNPYL
jgi:hypothetical protein